MFHRTTSAIAALALLSTATVSIEAMAADLPSRRAPPVFVPPPPIPVFTWTGLYIGGQVGYQFGADRALAYSNAFGVGYSSTSAKENGIIGGGHVGYNFSTQSIPGLGGVLGTGGVFGVEGDVDGSNYHANYLLGDLGDASRTNIQGSIRGRLGVAVDRVLFYATGGVAFGDLKNTYINTFNGSTDSLNRNRIGYTVGGGVEYAVTNNVSVRAEYRYTDYGTFSDNLANTSAGGLDVRHHETNNRVQAGFSYKFDSLVPPPVVARY